MYKRVLLKLSGESLKGTTNYGIDPQTVKQVASQIKDVVDHGIQVGLVVGGGNIFRGQLGEELGMDRAQADYMGMLATVMNSLAVQDALEDLGVQTRVMSALAIADVCEEYIRRRALRHFDKGRVVIFAGGTGIPYFTTDTAAALRGTEIGADVILMAKNGVKGVYDKDPRKFADAKFYSSLTFSDLIEQNLQVMDQTAASICKDNHVEIVVFNVNEEGNILKAALGQDIGTVIK